MKLTPLQTGLTDERVLDAVGVPEQLVAAFTVSRKSFVSPKLILPQLDGGAAL